MLQLSCGGIHLWYQYLIDWSRRIPSSSLAWTSKQDPVSRLSHTKVYKGLKTSTDLPGDPEIAIKMGKYMVEKWERKRRTIQMLWKEAELKNQKSGTGWCGQPACHLGPGWCLGLGCCQRPCWGPTAARVWVDIYDPCCHQRLQGCLGSALPPRAMMTSKNELLLRVISVYVALL